MDCKAGCIMFLGLLRARQRLTRSIAESRRMALDGCWAKKAAVVVGEGTSGPAAPIGCMLV